MGAHRQIVGNRRPHRHFIIAGMAVLTLRISKLRAMTVIECNDRLCQSTHPETGKVCEGAGGHLGQHSYADRGSFQPWTKWPNERVSMIWSS